MDVPLVSVEPNLGASELAGRISSNLRVAVIVPDVRTRQNDVNLAFFDDAMSLVHALSHDGIHREVMHMPHADDVGLKVVADVDDRLELGVLEAAT